MRKIGASEKLRPVVACAVDESRDLHTIFDRPIEDEIIADGQKAEFRCEIRPCLAGVRLRGEDLA